MTIIPKIILSTFLFLITFIFVRFLKEISAHRKRMRKLNEWSKFNQKLVDWSHEITDVNIKLQYISECVGRLTSNDKIIDSNHGNHYEGLIDDFSFEEEKQKIYKKWGKHIPSLTSEERESKLNKIL
jgi:hypothetical protein